MKWYIGYTTKGTHSTLRYNSTALAGIFVSTIVLTCFPSWGGKRRGGLSRWRENAFFAIGTGFGLVYMQLFLAEKTCAVDSILCHEDCKPCGRRFLVRDLLSLVLDWNIFGYFRTKKWDVYMGLIPTALFDVEKSDILPSSYIFSYSRALFSSNSHCSSCVEYGQSWMQHRPSFIPWFVFRSVGHHQRIIDTSFTNPKHSTHWGAFIINVFNSEKLLNARKRYRIVGKVDFRGWGTLNYGRGWYCLY